MFRLALCQMLVLPGRKRENIARAIGLIASAAANGAQVVLLPEAMDLGWCTPAGAGMADAIPDGETSQALANAAKKWGVYICSGLVEKCDGRIYNAAVLIDASGRIVLTHRKINELEIAHSVYDLGERVGVCETPFGMFGLMICADAIVKDQVISRTLCQMGVQVILSPSAWAAPADHDNSRQPYGPLWIDSYGLVCREFGVWIAGCSNVGWCEYGAWKGWKLIGNSIVVDGKGQVALVGPYGENAEAILYVDVEPARTST